MGRRNIMNQSSADVNVPGYANLVDAILQFKQAEKDFYESRENALKEYPGLSRKKADDIEKEYDKLYGDDPWNYSSRAGTSSDERTETDASTDSNGDDDESVAEEELRIPKNLFSLSSSLSPHMVDPPSRPLRTPLPPLSSVSDVADATKDAAAASMET